MSYNMQHPGVNKADKFYAQGQYICIVMSKLSKTYVFYVTEKLIVQQVKQLQVISSTKSTVTAKVCSSSKKSVAWIN